MHWLAGTDGLLFGRYGTVFGSKAPIPSLRSPATSVEIWAEPNRWDISATILTLYDARQRTLFAVRQSLTDIEIITEMRGKRRHVYADDGFGPALRQNRAVLVTITTASSGTVVYLDGTAFRTWHGLVLPPDAMAGRSILGDSPGEANSFSGKVFGLAIYGIWLNPDDVRRHYRAWAANHRPELRPEDAIQALYLFNERGGSSIHDYASVRGDLYIPTKYEVLEKERLKPFWREFEWSFSYWKGNLKNIIGFVPAGFVFYAYFRIVRRVKRPWLVTVIAGFLISFSIEVIQGFLPTRDSGTTDLITNGIGTGLGAWWFQTIYPTLSAKLSSAVADTAQLK